MSGGAVDRDVPKVFSTRVAPRRAGKLRRIVDLAPAATSANNLQYGIQIASKKSFRKRNRSPGEKYPASSVGVVNGTPRFMRRPLSEQAVAWLLPLLESLAVSRRRRFQTTTQAGHRGDQQPSSDWVYQLCWENKKAPILLGGGLDCSKSGNPFREPDRQA